MIPFSLAAPKHPRNEVMVTIRPMTIAAMPMDPERLRISSYERDVIKLPPPMRINPASL